MPSLRPPIPQGDAVSKRGPTEETLEGWGLDAYEGQFSPMAWRGDKEVWLEVGDRGELQVSLDDPADGHTYVPVTVLRRFMEMCEAWWSRTQEPKP